VSNIHITSNENACLSYLKKTVIHKSYYLNKRYSCIEEIPYEDENLNNLISINPYKDIILDIDFTNYLKTLSYKEQTMLKLIYEYGISDSKIAEVLGISRQYVNRTKKKLYINSKLSNL